MRLMHTVTGGVLLACVLVPPARAEAQVSQSPTPPVPMRAEPVRYQSGPDTVNAVLYLPRAPGKRPGIVVIHEWWGLNDWVKESAEKIAREGYVTLAVDLYRGHVADNADDAHELMRGVPEDRARRDLQTAAEYLRARKEVDPERIGVIGWCMGGGYALEAAMAVGDIRASVVCYGRVVEDDASIASIHGSLLGLFGAEDRGIPPEQVTRFAARARELGKDVSVHVYDSAAHAFMNVNNNRGYHAQATADAWRRIFAFFERTLGARKPE